MIIYVNSFEEAKAYPVMFNTSEIFLDANQDKFYCKAVDRMGKFTMSTYEFHQIENEKPLTSADFVPREQFNTLTQKLDNLMALLTSSQPIIAPSVQTPLPTPPVQQPTIESSEQTSKQKGVNHHGK